MISLHCTHYIQRAKIFKRGTSNRQTYSKKKRKTIVKLTTNGLHFLPLLFYYDLYLVFFFLFVYFCQVTFTFQVDFDLRLTKTKFCLNGLLLWRGSLLLFLSRFWHWNFIFFYYYFYLTFMKETEINFNFKLNSFGRGLAS